MTQQSRACKTLDTLFDDAVFSALEARTAGVSPAEMLDRARDMAYIGRVFELANYPMVEPAGIQRAWSAFSKMHGEDWLPPQLFDADAIIATVVHTLLGR